MRFFARFLLLFPLLEIIGFVAAGALFGAGPTLAAWLITTALGIYLLRSYRWLAIMQMQTQLKAGYVSSDAMQHHGFIILAGILLVLPGFFSDFLGLLCLVPAIRSGLLKKLLNLGWLKDAQAAHEPKEARVIEGEYWQVEDKER